MNISSFQKCANCGACSNICPTGAITVEENGLFYQPIVDEDKCIDCGLCSRRCPLNGSTDSFAPIYACAGWHKSEQVVKQSSSGGVFHGLAQYVIHKGGLVFGASFSEDFRKVQFVSSDEADIAQLRKSKYTESLTGTTFKQVKAALSAGRAVLFCGTPCQISGLYAFLGNRPEGLVSCDFACGGLPSHKIYQDYLRNLEKKYGAEVSSVDFRPKTHGWRRYAMLIKFKNHRIYNRLGVEDPFLKSFLYGKYTVRKDCLDCKFSDHHASDITIADFWLNTKFSGPDHPNGVSLVLCNTMTGKQTIGEIRDQYEFWDMPTEKVSYNHKPTETAPEGYEKREAFLRIYEEKGLEAACKVYLPDSIKTRGKNYLRRILHKSRG